MSDNTGNISPRDQTEHNAQIMYDKAIETLNNYQFLKAEADLISIIPLICTDIQIESNQNLLISIISKLIFIIFINNKPVNPADFIKTKLRALNIPNFNSFWERSVDQFASDIITNSVKFIRMLSVDFFVKLNPFIYFPGKAENSEFAQISLYVSLTRQCSSFLDSHLTETIGATFFDRLFSIFKKIDSNNDLRSIDEKRLRALMKDFRELITSRELISRLDKFETNIMFIFCQSTNLGKEFDGLLRFNELPSLKPYLDRIIRSGIIKNLLGTIHESIVMEFGTFLVKLYEAGFKDFDILAEFWHISLNQYVSVIDKFFTAWSRLFIRLPQSVVAEFWPKCVYTTKSFPPAALTFLCQFHSRASSTTKDKVFNTLWDAMNNANQEDQKIEYVNALYHFLSPNTPLWSEIKRKCFDFISSGKNVAFSVNLLSFIWNSNNVELTKKELDSILDILTHLNQSISVTENPEINSNLTENLKQSDQEGLINTNSVLYLKKFIVQLFGLIGKMSTKVGGNLSKSEIDGLKPLLLIFLDTVSDFEAKRFISQISPYLSKESSFEMIQWLCDLPHVDSRVFSLIQILFYQLNNLTTGQPFDVPLKKLLGIQPIWHLLFTSNLNDVPYFMARLITNSSDVSSASYYVSQCMKNISNRGSLFALYLFVYRIEETFDLDFFKITRNQFQLPDAFITVNITGEITQILRIPYDIKTPLFVAKIARLLDTREDNVIIFYEQERLSATHIFKADQQFHIQKQQGFGLPIPPIREWNPRKNELPSQLIQPHFSTIYALLDTDDNLSYDALRLLNIIRTDLVEKEKVVSLINCKENNETKNWDELLTVDAPFRTLYRLNIIGNLMMLNNRLLEKDFFENGGFKRILDILFKTRETYTLNAYIRLILALTHILLNLGNKTSYLKEIKNKVLKETGSANLPELVHWITTLLQTPNNVSVKFCDSLFEILSEIVYLNRDILPGLDEFPELVSLSLFHPSDSIRLGIQNTMKALNPSHYENVLFANIEKSIYGKCVEYFTLMHCVIKNVEDPTSYWTILTNFLMTHLIIYQSNENVHLEFENDPLPMFDNENSIDNNHLDGIKSKVKDLCSFVADVDFIQNIFNVLLCLNFSMKEIPNDKEFVDFVINRIVFNTQQYIPLPPSCLTLLSNIIGRNPTSMIPHIVDQITKYHNISIPSPLLPELAPNSRSKGLVNMGATCYLNSSLQQILRVRQIRDALFRYDGTKRKIEIEKQSKDNNIVTNENTSIAELSNEMNDNPEQNVSNDITEDSKEVINHSTAKEAEANSSETVLNGNNNIKADDNSTVKENGSVETEIETPEKVVDRIEYNSTKTENDSTIKEDNSTKKEKVVDNFITIEDLNIIKIENSKNNAVSNDDWASNLQLVAAKLLYSPFATVDPSPFVSHWKGWDDQPINPHEQQDAGEFVQMLLDRLNDTLEGKPVLNSVIGQFEERIQQINGDYSNESLSVFTVLPLQVKNHTKFSDSFKTFLEPDNLTGKDKYSVENLGMIDAERFHTIYKAPETLIILLKRFEFDLETLSSRKVNSYFEFTSNLDLRPIISEDSSKEEKEKVSDYELTGIVMHSGCAVGGHYYSYIMNDGKWNCFNDSSVYPLEGNFMERCFGGRQIITVYDPTRKKNVTEQIERTESAYLLFYKQKSRMKNDAIEPITLMPKQPLMKLLTDIEHAIIRNMMVSIDYANFIGFIIDNFRYDENSTELPVYDFLYQYLLKLLKFPGEDPNHQITFPHFDSIDAICTKIRTKAATDKKFADFILTNSQSIIDFLLTFGNELMRIHLLAIVNSSISNSSSEVLSQFIASFYNTFNDNSFLLYWKNFDQIFGPVLYYIETIDSDRPDILESIINVFDRSMLLNSEQFFYEVNLSTAIKIFMKIVISLHLIPQYCQKIEDPRLIESMSKSQKHLYDFSLLVMRFKGENQTSTSNYLKYISSQNLTPKSFAAYFAASITLEDSLTTQRIKNFISLLRIRCSNKWNSASAANFFNETARILNNNRNNKLLTICKHTDWITYLFESDQQLRSAVSNFIRSIYTPRTANLLLNCLLTNLNLCVDNCLSYSSATSIKSDDAYPTAQYFDLLYWSIQLGNFTEFIIEQKSYFVRAMNQFSNLSSSFKRPIIDMLNFLNKVLADTQINQFFDENTMTTFLNTLSNIPSGVESYIESIMPILSHFVLNMQNFDENAVASSKIFKLSLNYFLDESNSAMSQFFYKIVAFKSAASIAEAVFTESFFKKHSCIKYSIELMRKNNSTSELFLKNNCSQYVIDLLINRYENRSSIQSYDSIIHLLNVLIVFSKSYIDAFQETENSSLFSWITRRMSRFYDFWADKKVFLAELFKWTSSSSVSPLFAKAIFSLLGVVYSSDNQFAKSAFELISNKNEKGHNFLLEIDETVVTDYFRFTNSIANSFSREYPREVFNSTYSDFVHILKNYKKLGATENIVLLCQNISITIKSTSFSNSNLLKYVDLFTNLFKTTNDISVYQQKIAETAFLLGQEGQAAKKIIPQWSTLLLQLVSKVIKQMNSIDLNGQSIADNDVIKKGLKDLMIARDFLTDAKNLSGNSPLFKDLIVDEISHLVKLLKTDPNCNDKNVALVLFFKNFISK